MGETNTMPQPFDRAEAAVRTLERLGYTHTGGREWRPPLGPTPDFDAIDKRRAEAMEKAVERVCHEEQLRVWANDLVGALSLDGFIRDDMSYDDGLDLERTVMLEIKSTIVMAFNHPERVAGSEIP